MGYKNGLLVVVLIFPHDYCPLSIHSPIHHHREERHPPLPETKHMEQDERDGWCKSQMEYNRVRVRARGRKLKSDDQETDRNKAATLAIQYYPNDR